jgi:dipeptidyl-peptidase-4
LKTPLLVVHGMADNNVLFTHSTQLFELMQHADLPLDMMIFSGEKHGLLRNDRVGRHGYMTPAGFLGRHLKPQKE